MSSAKTLDVPTMQIVVDHTLLSDAQAMSEVLRAVADCTLSSAGAQDHPEWYAADYRKTVRGVSKHGQAQRIFNEARDEQRFSCSTHNTRAMHTLVVEPSTTTGRLMARAQVTGWSAREPWPGEDADAVDHVECVVLDSLTTGKACAQVGHVASLLEMAHHDQGHPQVSIDATDAGQVLEFLSHVPVRCTRVDAELLALAAEDPDALVRVIDNGHTEVEPGTLTCVLLRHN